MKVDQCVVSGRPFGFFLLVVDVISLRGSLVSGISVIF